jgi:hypothetical protein
MSCSIHATLEKDCLLASQEFDRLKDEVRLRIGSLSEQEYKAMSARVIEAGVREQQAQTALRDHMREHGC